jgi:hypothetical protein
LHRASAVVNAKRNELHAKPAAPLTIEPRH